MNNQQQNLLPPVTDDGIEPLISEYERSGKPLPPLVEWNWSPATAETSVGLEPELIVSEYERSGKPLPPMTELLWGTPDETRPDVTDMK
jgi:hypothetical protein